MLRKNILKMKIRYKVFQIILFLNFTRVVNEITKACTNLSCLNVNQEPITVCINDYRGFRTGEEQRK